MDKSQTIKERALRKLKRSELLEIMLAQSEEIDELKKQIEDLKKEREEKDLVIKNAGSIAEASLELTKVFEEAQKAADLYVNAVKQKADADSSENI
jgi:hypothetical protein